MQEVSEYATVVISKAVSVATNDVMTPLRFAGRHFDFHVPIKGFGVVVFVSPSSLEPQEYNVAIKRHKNRDINFFNTNLKNMRLPFF